MKKILFVALIFVLIFPAWFAQADTLTHTIGNTGYMIREAMQAKAYKYDAAGYRQALKLQNEAKQYLRGTHKKGRSTEQALLLTKQAYDLAKKARDTALSAQHLKVSS